MTNYDQNFEDRLQVIEQNIRHFRETFKNRTKDPKNFLTLTDIEKMWSELNNSTELIYSDIIKDMIKEIDEKSLIKEKKTSSEAKELS